MYGCFILKSSDCFMKNCHFDTICSITQEPRELGLRVGYTRCNGTCGFIGKSDAAVISSIIEI